MTEVPDYLLRRSKERREALGLAPKDDSSGEGSPSAPEAAGAPAAAAPASAEVAVPAAAPAAAATPTEQLPSYVAPPAPRSGVPVWMMPVLIILPLWAVVYVGSFGTSASTATGPPQGSAVYQKAGCGGCHGMKGEGGVGPALAGGDSKLTFPNAADQIAWIENGSASSKGKPYGDPNRPGGPKVATSGGMPGFSSQLTPEEIQAVVEYEREQL